MPPRADHPTAIVTGGGYGIGRAACRLLAEDGWRLVIVDRDEARAAGTLDIVGNQGSDGVVVVGDVTCPETAARAVEVAASHFGGLDGLVTCAAMRHPGTITEISVEQWDETLAVVLRGVFLFCKASVPAMASRGGGAIVNVSSPDAYGRRGMVAYAAGKAAVNALTVSLAADHLHDHIRVNAVLPGFTVTGMTEHYDDERLRELAGRSVAGRVAEPEDPARLICFLMSPAGATFTGGLFGGRPIGIR